MKALLLLGLLSCWLFLFQFRGAGQENEDQTAKLLVKFLGAFHKQLNSQDSNSRIEAVKSLAVLSSGVRSGANSLSIRTKFDSSSKVKIEAAKVIMDLGGITEVAVPNLIEALDDKDDQVRVAVISALGANPFHAKKAIPKLMEMGKDKNPQIRRWALGVLGNFGPMAREAIPALIAALNDPDEGERGPRLDPSVKQRVCTSLGNIGPDAKAAIPALWKLQNQKDSNGKGEALIALAKITPGDVKLVPVLVDNLKKSDKSLAAYSVAALRILGRRGKDAIPALILVLSAKDDKKPGPARVLKSRVLSYLGELGAFAKEAIPAVQNVADSDLALREQALAVLKKIEGK